MVSTSISELILSGDEFLDTSIICTSSSTSSCGSASGTSWLETSCSETSSVSASGSFAGIKSNLTNYSSSSVKPDEAVFTSIPSTFA